MLQGQKAGFLSKTKNSSQRNMQYFNISHIDFKSTFEIYFKKNIFLGFLEKPKFQMVIFFTNHDRGSLEGAFTTNVSMVLLTKIHAQ